MQTPLQSLMEQMANVGSGFFISMLYTIYVVAPQIEHREITFALSLSITAQFTVLSIARGYCFRRLFNYWIYHYATR